MHTSNPAPSSSSAEDKELFKNISTREHNRINVKAKPFTFKAEISLEWKDMKDFFRGLVKGSSTNSRETGDTRSHRSARDTEPEMSAAESGDGPWISNLSPAAVVGTIVGGTIGIFVIVVLTVIICSYKNYTSLEMRQRTSDVYSGGNGYRQAERRM
nr:uncharacterized protein LOC129282141 [Lytechinus pictus]